MWLRQKASLPAQTFGVACVLAAAPRPPSFTVPTCFQSRPHRANILKVDLAEGTVTIDGSMAKTRQRRIFKLSENAAAWLTDYAVQKPPLTFTNFKRGFARVKNAAGFNGREGAKGLLPWVTAYMRHTAIRNHFAYHKHERATASRVGNSPNVIHRHYKALVKGTDAKEFGKSRPPT